MAITVTKRFRPLVDGKRTIVHIPYTLYTIDEAKEKGIPYDLGWRAKFRELVDLTGTWIVTDDDPPYVVPVVRCYYLPYRYKKSGEAGPEIGSGGPMRKMDLPWTTVNGMRAKINVGVRNLAVRVQLTQRKRRLTKLHLKLFIVMLALMVDPLKAVEQIFRVEDKVDQRYFLRKLMQDERTNEAAQSVAAEVLEAAGIDAKDVARELKKMLDDPKMSAVIRMKIGQDFLDRLGVKDKSSVPDFQAIFTGSMLPPATDGVTDQLQEMMDREIQKLPEGGNTRRLGAGGETGSKGA